MNVELLIPVCISYTLDQCIDHLVKLKQISGAAMYTAEVQLLCSQMNGGVKRWRDELTEKEEIFSSYLFFKNCLS